MKRELLKLAKKFGITIQHYNSIRVGWDWNVFFSMKIGSMTSARQALHYSLLKYGDKDRAITDAHELLSEYKQKLNDLHTYPK